MYGDQAFDSNSVQPMVDANGMPLPTPPQQDPNYPQQQSMVRPDGTGEPSQQELDQAFPPQQQQQQQQQQRQPRPQQRPQPDPLAPPPEAPQPRPNTP